jgi:hypothetical protein
MFDILPVEVILETLSYLPVQTLRELQLVSRNWTAFIAANETSIYKKAALLHGYLPSPDITSPSDLWTIYSERSLIGVEGWKDLCKSVVVRHDIVPTVLPRLQTLSDRESLVG